MTPLMATGKWFKLLVYADHGVGKTELGATAVDVLEMRDVLLINAERGEATINESPRIINKEMLSVISVENYKIVAHIHDWLKAHCAARDRADTETLKRLESAITNVSIEQIEQPKIFRTVILDTLSEIESYSVYSILGINQSELLREDDDSVETAGWPEFRKNFESVKLLIRAFRDLPLHVIFLCQAKYKQDQFKKFYYMPYLTGQLAREVQGFVDTVGYLVTGPTQADGKPAPRRMFIQPVQFNDAPKFDAKNRRASFDGPFIDNPKMQDIMRLLGLIRRGPEALEAKMQQATAS